MGKNNNHMLIPEKEAFEEIIDNISLFERKDLKIGEFSGIEGYSYHPEIDIFIDDLNKMGFIQKFDWQNWIEELDRFSENPELLKKADAETIIKILTTIVRGERFFAGILYKNIENGFILKILYRLKDILETINESYN